VITVLGILGPGAVLASGALMVSRPASYVGRGFVPASDPQTVRRFGLVMVVGAGIILVLNLVRLAQG
jgi:hypothetical protein